MAEAYRRVFVDLDALVTWIAQGTPAPRRILEVGCGEGAMTQRLAAVYRDAAILAIDVSPAAGRLFRGDRSRVEIRQTDIAGVVASAAHTFDLVLLCDVLHHVPVALRSPFLRHVRDAVTSGGTLVFKDWARSTTPIHWMCEFSDRYITGDEVSYYSAAGLRNVAVEHFGRQTICEETTIRPWRNNVAFRVTPHASDS